MTPHGKHKPEKSRLPRHWILWTLVVVFIVGAITAMMMADYYFAPGSNDTSAVPKDAAEK